MADYGFDADLHIKPQGGTEKMDGDLPFKVINPSKIMTELYRLHSVGEYMPNRKWNDMIVYGEGPGALQIGVTPLGSMRIVARRLTKDLVGEETWICKQVIPLSDNKDELQEISIAHKAHDALSEISTQNLDAPAKEYDSLDRLSWKLWSACKRHHPSYIMFPIGLRKQNENYYKLVFEFRGQGVLRQDSRTGRAEQYNIDLLWDKGKGLIRCWGYDISSTLGQHSWTVQPSDFNEWFAPGQSQEEIVDNIIKIFMQY